MSATSIIWNPYISLFQHVSTCFNPSYSSLSHHARNPEDVWIIHILAARDTKGGGQSPAELGLAAAPAAPQQRAHLKSQGLGKISWMFVATFSRSVWWCLDDLKELIYIYIYVYIYICIYVYIWWLKDIDVYSLNIRRSEGILVWIICDIEARYDATCHWSY